MLKSVFTLQLMVDGEVRSALPTSGRFHLYLRGQRGIAVAEYLARIDPLRVASFQVEGSVGVSADDGSEAITAILAGCGAQRVEVGGTPDHSLIRLAVGWRFLLPVEPSPLFVIHDSLLPKLRGWNASVTSLLSVRDTPGVTMFLADTSIDGGPILSQVATPVPDFSPISELLVVQEPSLHGLLHELILQVDDGNIHLRSQDGREASYSMWRDSEDYRIDWVREAESILRHIRASGEPYEGAYTVTRGETIRVLDAQLVLHDPEIVNRNPGKVLHIDADGPIVVCGRGLLKLTHLRDAYGELVRIRSVRTRFV